MRLRLLIPAAIAAVATYAALVRDETAPAGLRPPPQPIPPPPGPAGNERPSPPGSHYDDLTGPAPESPSPSVYDLLAGTPPPEEAVPPPEPDPWAAPIEEGRFALGGFAAAAGHSVVSGVTFRRRLHDDPAAERIRLAIDASENVADPSGLIVLADPGFAPDREGFTLRLSAAGAGPFSAAGSYSVLPAT